MDTALVFAWTGPVVGREARLGRGGGVALTPAPG
jgi:hypothetical protein